MRYTSVLAVLSALLTPASVILALLIPGRAVAEFAAAAEFVPPQTALTLPVQWTALPLSGQGVDPVVSKPAAGAWQVKLVPGMWLIHGQTADGQGFEIITTLDAGENPQVEVPLIENLVQIAYRCPGPDTCALSDPGTGLDFILPPGWAAEPLHMGPSGPVGGFFELTDESGAYWALNPEDWGDSGPCRVVTVGRLCTFEESPATTRGFEVLGPGLKLQAN